MFWCTLINEMEIETDQFAQRIKWLSDGNDVTLTKAYKIASNESKVKMIGLTLLGRFRIIDEIYSFALYKFIEQFLSKNKFSNLPKEFSNWSGLRANPIEIRILKYHSVDHLLFDLTNFVVEPTLSFSITASENSKLWAYINQCLSSFWKTATQHLKMQATTHYGQMQTARLMLQLHSHLFTLRDVEEEFKKIDSPHLSSQRRDDSPIRK